MPHQREFAERFARACLDIYGEEGEFSVSVECRDIDPVCAAFEQLGCAVECDRNCERLSIKVIRQMATLHEP